MGHPFIVPAIDAQFFGTISSALYPAQVQAGTVTEFLRLQAIHCNGTF